MRAPKGWFPMLGSAERQQLWLYRQQAHMHSKQAHIYSKQAYDILSWCAHASTTACVLVLGTGSAHHPSTVHA